MSMPARRGTSQGWIPGIFNDFFNNEWMIRSNATAPAINVFECDNRYTVEVAAPGMTKEDFSIRLNNDNNLTICMEKNCNCKDGRHGDCKEKDGEQKSAAEIKNTEERSGRYLRREFSYTKFQQTLILPENADTSKIDAKVSNGVLCIEIPKKKPEGAENISREIHIG